MRSQKGDVRLASPAVRCAASGMVKDGTRANTVLLTSLMLSTARFSNNLPELLFAGSKNLFQRLSQSAQDGQDELELN